MENFAPGLKESVLSVSAALRVIVYFVCVTGLVLHVQQSRGDVEGLVRPLLRAAVIVALVATLPTWFAWAEQVFLAIANTVQAGYTDHPMRAATKLRELAAGSETAFSLRRIGESLYYAFLFGAAKLMVLSTSLVQLPFLVLQYVLKLLCYLFLPVALGMYMIPALSSWATRYVQQTLAILAWPVGFAVTELVGYHLIIGYGENLALAYHVKPGELDAASFGSVLGGILGGLWLLVGTLATPFLMQGLICGGSPVSAGGSAALQQIYSVQQLMWMVKSAKTAGLAAPAMVASAAAKDGGEGPPLPPPPGASPLPPPTVGPMAPDPSGEIRANAALAHSQLPSPYTAI
jgi:hypothetical protein